MRVKVRRALVVTASVAAVGFATCMLVHTEFQAMKLVLVIGEGIAMCLFLTAGVIKVAGREAVSRAVVRIAIVVALAVPFAFLATPIVFRLDLWLLKRYVALELKPALERQHARDGAYPTKWSLYESPPAGAPWLLKWTIYSSEGGEYFLAVMHPGVCGQVFGYQSSTDRWSESYEPCFY